MKDSANIPLNTNDAEPGKRTLLAMLGAFGILTASVVCLSLGARACRTNPTNASRQGSPDAATSAARSNDQVDPEVAAFLGPLAVERRFETWRITQIDPLQFGRMTFRIEGSTGDSFIIDVHARSPQAPPPIAETTHLALYVRMNQAGGQTPEAFIQACNAFARALRAREDAGASAPALQSLVPR